MTTLSWVGAGYSSVTHARKKGMIENTEQLNRSKGRSLGYNRSVVTASVDNPTYAVGRWAGPIAIIVTGVVMVYWSWGAWPDVLVDFGRELYVPWQLTEGKALYVDIAYLNGPLSPYVNALWFRLFGVSVLTLVLCNIALLTVLVWLAFRLLRRIAGRFAATCACLTLLTVFAFTQPISVGNYNFVCPYSHELTHGLLLCTASIACLSRYRPGSGPLWLIGAGAALGLAFLTKAEVFLAGAVAVTTGLALMIWLERPGRRAAIRLTVLFISSMLLPPAMAFGLFNLVMPADQALRAAAGSLVYVFGEGLLSLDYYRKGLGLLDPGASVIWILAWIVRHLALFLPVGLLSLALRKPGAYRAAIAVIVSLGVAGALAWNVREIEWRKLLLPWPLFVGAICVIAFIRAVRRPADGEARSRLLLICTLSVFALALLAKMVLNTRVYHYGFALAMPATLLIVVTLTDWIPAFIASRGGYAWLFRGPALAAMAVAVFVHVHRSHEVYNAKTHLVSGGADAFGADVRGDAVNTMLDEIETHVPPDASLAVFPEGVMINYLSRRANPTSYINFMPPELIVFGESNILAAFQDNPPDFVVLVHKDTSEYGPRFFGRDYGQELFTWIRENYQPVSLVGATPLQTDDFGILLLEASLE